MSDDSESPGPPELPEEDRPLQGVLVLDLSQFLAGPVAALRLADLGARVIKIERPGTGELGRDLAFAGAYSDGESLSFQLMNRNKESVVADLKNPADLAAVRRLAARADVVIQNFRPGVPERLGLDYPALALANPRLIYASLTGYGETGPWRDLPGQDLLVQAVSGLPWLNGNQHSGPVPVGLSVADLLGSCHLATGVIALLLRRERTGRGGIVQTSLLEGVLDLQLELVGAALNDPDLVVRRGEGLSASAFLPAPYGIYPTQNGYLAIAMNPIPRLGALLDIPALSNFGDPETWWARRDEIEQLLAGRLRTRPTEHWLDVLTPTDVWCTQVLTLRELINHAGFSALAMTQQTSRRGEDGSEHSVQTTRSPLRIDGAVLTSHRGAPRLGADTRAVLDEFESGDEVPSGQNQASA